MKQIRMKTRQQLTIVRRGWPWTQKIARSLKQIEIAGTEAAAPAHTSRETMGSKLPRSGISNSSSSLPEVHRGGGQQESSQRRHVADMPRYRNCQTTKTMAEGRITSAERNASRWTSFFCVLTNAEAQLGKCQSRPFDVVKKVLYRSV